MMAVDWSNPKTILESRLILWRRVRFSNRQDYRNQWIQLSHSSLWRIRSLLTFPTNSTNWASPSKDNRSHNRSRKCNRKRSRIRNRSLKQYLIKINRWSLIKTKRSSRIHMFTIRKNIFGRKWWRMRRLDHAICRTTTWRWIVKILKSKPIFLNINAEGTCIEIISIWR